MVRISDKQKTRKKQMAMTKNKALEMALLGMLLILVLSQLSMAAPTGATLANVSTTQKTGANPNNGNHSKGTINTIRLTAEQQDLKWKAYVGNVSSTFVLDDANDISIYQWTINSFTGQVYLARNGTVDWANTWCANVTNKVFEDTQIGHSPTSDDSVNTTFRTKAHKGFTVGTNPISLNSCYATATWANDTVQTPSASTPFTEILLWDITNSAMIYTTFVENDVMGYKNFTSFDFQVIVPEDGVQSNPALRYYFYLELTST